MLVVRGGAKKHTEAEALQASDKRVKRNCDVEDDDDFFDNDLSSEIKGIVSALEMLKQKAHKDGQKKKEETISRQTFAKALSKSSKEPRKECFEIRMESGETFISLLTSLRKVEYTRKHKADLYLAALGNRASVSLVEHKSHLEELQTGKVGVVKSLKQEKEQSLQKFPIRGGGKVKEAGIGDDWYKVVEVGGNLDELNDMLLATYHGKVNESLNYKKMLEPEEKGEEVKVEAEKRDVEEKKDAIEVVVRVVDTIHRAEVSVGEVSRQHCRDLETYVQLKAIVSPLVQQGGFSLFSLNKMFCQALANEKYVSLPKGYKAVIEVTDRIMVQEDQV